MINIIIFCLQLFVSNPVIPADNEYILRTHTYEEITRN